MTVPRHGKPPKRIAFLGGFSPRQCGIATFTHDICEAVAQAEPEADCFAVAVNDGDEVYAYPPRVRLQLKEKDLSTYRRAADFLNFSNVDVLCVQHEFGIYGGAAGSHLLALLREAKMPVVTTLHTLLRDPNSAQLLVMNELIKRSSRLVVMAEKGIEILRETYGVEENIDVIPHGIPDIPYVKSRFAKERLGLKGRMVLLTFGLLGPGKGIEHVIESLPEIVRQYPNVVYVVLGATHPHLMAHEGERYRMSLERLAEERGVKEHLIFHNRFASQEELVEFISATDIYLTPYLNEAQITSGTLAYVFGAGKAVVSTPYWHAKELLTKGRGTLVPFSDPRAISEAVCAYLRDPVKLGKTRKEAYRSGREMVWPATARRYLNAFQRACSERKELPRTAFAGWTLSRRPYAMPPVRMDHLLRMTDSTGIFQHALFNVPDFNHGYCTDDNARGFLLCKLLGGLGQKPPGGNLEELSTRYLAFLAAALNRPLGRFHNFMNYSRQWLDEVGSEDSHGRALWALGTGAFAASHEGRRELSSQLFKLALPVVETFTSPRAWAFTLLGLRGYLLAHAENEDARRMREVLVNKLVVIWDHSSSEDWQWYEESHTYDNARICQAMLITGQGMSDPVVVEIGLKSLKWLVEIQKTSAGHFRPIGSNGFHVKGGHRAIFDQQPVEAQAMVSACLDAYSVTQETMWSNEARRAFEWFLGRNDLGLPLYDSSTGGCRDGLHKDRVNQNQGAESTLAFHLALAEMNLAEQAFSQPQPTSDRHETTYASP